MVAIGVDKSAVVEVKSFVVAVVRGSKFVVVLGDFSRRV